MVFVIWALVGVVRFAPLAMRVTAVYPLNVPPFKFHVIVHDSNIAIGRVSLCVPSRVQVLVSTPAAFMVAGVVTCHDPQACPSAAAPVWVSLCVPSRVQVLVFIPASVQVGAVVCVYAPQE